MYAGGQVGVSDFHSKDDHINPLTYSGGIFATSLSWEIVSRSGRHMVRVDYSYGNVNSAYRQDDASNVLFSGSYTYCTKIAGADLLGRRTDFLLGGGLSAGGWYTNYVEARSRYSTWYVWTYYLSENLNLVGRCEYDIARNSQLYLDIVLPVVQLVSRPAYSGWGEEDQMANVLHPRLHFLWNNLSATARVGYTVPFAGALMIKLDYIFSYAYAPDPLPVRMYNNNFLAGLYLRL